MTPAAFAGAVLPERTVQARTSFRSGGEVSLQAEQTVGAADHAVETRLSRRRVPRETHSCRRPRAGRFRPRWQRTPPRPCEPSVAVELLDARQQRVGMETALADVGDVQSHRLSSSAGAARGHLPLLRLEPERRAAACPSFRPARTRSNTIARTQRILVLRLGSLLGSLQPLIRGSRESASARARY